MAFSPYRPGPLPRAMPLASAIGIAAAVAPTGLAEPRPVTPRGPLLVHEQALVRLFSEAAPSVAYLTTEQLRATGFFTAAMAQGAGSGFVRDSTGHVVTNHHVVEGARRVFVKLDASRCDRGARGRRRAGVRPRGGQAGEGPVRRAADSARLVERPANRPGGLRDRQPLRPAAHAGLQPLHERTGELGDVIVAVNGRRVETLSNFVAGLDRVGVDKTAELTVERGGKQHRIRLRVIDRRALVPQSGRQLYFQPGGRLLRTLTSRSSRRCCVRPGPAAAPAAARPGASARGRSGGWPLR